MVNEATQRKASGAYPVPAASAFTVPVHTGLRRLCHRESKRSPAPTTTTAHPVAAIVQLVPGPVPPPVAGATTGALVVASGMADVMVPVDDAVGVLAVVAVPVGAAEPAWDSQRHPSLSSQVIALPSPATPDIPWSVVRQNSPGS